MTVHPALIPRRAPLLLALVCLWWVAAVPDIDREALRGAQTRGRILISQADGGQGSVLDGIDAGTADARRLRTETKAWMFSPCGSSDGKSLAVARVADQQASIELLDASGKTRRRWKVAAIPWLAWRPGTHTLAVANSLHAREDGLHLLDLDKNRWTLISGGAQHVWLAWSADGSRIAFSRLEPERNIYVLDLATGKERLLCPGVIPSWDPAGNRLAVIPRERNAIELVDAASGRRRTLLAGISPGRLRWSPDGRWLLTDDVRADHRAFLLVDVDAGVTRRIGRPSAQIQGYDWAP